MPQPSKPRYFRRFLAYTLNYRSLLAIAISMGVAKFLVNYTFPWLIGSAVNTFAPPPVGVDPPPMEDRMNWLWTLIVLGV
ncbi:MAG TPA: hypothetical protein PKB10_14865, partial [Tepidisphaeraceae bacterium]|nr:hypothetical protein [Tepidisphaeraceae bacterium]